jgi:type II secretory pathway pseudopilin PulG
MHTDRQPSPRPRRRPRQRLGLTLMETMVSLSITTMLLAGVATAFVTSADAVSANESFARSTQAARVTLNQILVEVRRADAVRCSSTGTYDYFDVIRPTETLDPNEVYRRYRFDAANRRMTMRLHLADGTDGPEIVMVRNVSAAEFGPPQMGVDSNNSTVVQRLPVSLSVGVGPNAITLNGAAGPRRALKF